MAITTLLHNGVIKAMTIRIRTAKSNPAARFPHQATVGSGGADLYADHTEVITSGKTYAFNTHLRCEIPRGFLLAIVGRSSMAKEGIRVSQGFGVIDSDYRGDIYVLLTKDTEGTYTIHEGDRIAQCFLVNTWHMSFREIPLEQLSSTERGSGGFGSTGK